MVPAYKALRRIAIALSLVGFLLLAFAVLAAKSDMPLSRAATVSGLTVGIILLLVGLAGPVRILLRAPKIPAEINSIIRIQAFCLPLSGASLGGLCFSQTTGLTVGLFILAAVCAFISAYFGFFRLSQKLPNNFFLSEMFSVIKSTGIFGKNSESAADREFMRWSGEKRTGAPAGKRAPDGTVTTLKGDSSSLLELCESSSQRAWSSILVLTLALIIENVFTNSTTSWINGAAKRLGFSLSILPKLIRKTDGSSRASTPQILNTPEMRRTFAFITPKPWRTAERWLNGWPIRLYVIEKGQILYCGEQGPFGYDPLDLDSFLSKMFDPNKTKN